MVKAQLESERQAGVAADQPSRAWHELSAQEQAALVKKRLADYSRKVF